MQELPCVVALHAHPQGRPWSGLDYKKSERVVQAKIRGIQKKNIFPVDWKPERTIQAKIRDSNKNNTKKKAEASQFKWAKWKNTPYAGLQMATFARLWLMGFIPKKWRFLLDFRLTGFIPEKWRLLPDSWLLGFIPKNCFTSPSVDTP